MLPCLTSRILKRNCSRLHQNSMVFVRKGLLSVGHAQGKFCFPTSQEQERDSCGVQFHYYIQQLLPTHTGKIQRVSRQQLIISSGPTPTLTPRHTLQLLSLSTSIFSFDPPPRPNLGYTQQFRHFHKSERHLAMVWCILCFRNPNFTSRNILPS